MTEGLKKIENALSIAKTTGDLGFLVAFRTSYPSSWQIALQAMVVCQAKLDISASKRLNLLGELAHQDRASSYKFLSDLACAILNKAQLVRALPRGAQRILPVGDEEGLGSLINSRSPAPPPRRGDVAPIVL